VKRTNAPIPWYTPKKFFASNFDLAELRMLIEISPDMLLHSALMLFVEDMRLVCRRVVL
jgi:hypothetical protein